MATAGSIGFGLLILLILWIITIIIFVVAIKLQNYIAWLVLGLTSALTVVLLSIPTEKLNTVKSHEFMGKDYIIIYKNFILIFLLISLLTGLFVFFLGYCIEPIRPKLFKSFHDQ